MKKSNLALCLTITILFFIYGQAFGQDSLYVDTNGNVGIGTADPNEKLEVVNSIDPSIGDVSLYIYNSSNNNWSYGETSSKLKFGKHGDVTGYIANIHTRGSGEDHSYEDAGLVFATLPVCGSEDCSESDLVERMVITHDGNVGIETTSPSDKLDIRPISYSSNQNGGIRICDTGGHWPHRIALKSDASGVPRLSFDTYAYSEVFTIRSSNGFIGVNKTVPTYRLDVNGPIRCTALTETSDMRLKKNIEPIESSIDKLTQLTGVYYEWADEESDSGKRIGLLAQEVEEVFPEAVSTDEDGIKSIAYGSLMAPLIEAVKELNTGYEELKMENDELKSENDDLKAENDEFRSRLEKLEEVVAQLQK